MTVRAVVVMGMTLVIAAVLLQVGLVIAAKHQAQASADLAALAGSAAELRGDDGCATARAVARRNRAPLERCRTDRAVVTVRAARPSRLMWGTRFRVHAEARGAPDFYVPASGVAEHQVEQPNGARLVEGFVAVAALR